MSQWEEADAVSFAVVGNQAACSQCTALFSQNLPNVPPADLRNRRFHPQLDHTWSLVTRTGKYLSKIKVLSQ